MGLNKTLKQLDYSQSFMPTGVVHKKNVNDMLTEFSNKNRTKGVLKKKKKRK